MEIVIAGPNKNALGTDVLTSLRDQVRAAGDAPLFVRGEGEVFSAGLNLKEIAVADERALRRFLELLTDVVVGLFRHPAPTVACVSGHAIAGGALVARACDYVVATTNPKTKIGLNETAIGLMFPPRLLAMTKFRLPVRSRVEVFLEGTLFDPQAAHRVGLVDQLAHDVEAVARERFATLGGLAGPAYAGNKALLLSDFVEPTPEAEAAFVDQMIATWTSPALKARLTRILSR